MWPVMQPRRGDERTDLDRVASGQVPDKHMKRCFFFACLFLFWGSGEGGGVLLVKCGRSFPRELFGAPSFTVTHLCLIQF